MINESESEGSDSEEESLSEKGVDDNYSQSEEEILQSKTVFIHVFIDVNLNI